MASGKIKPKREGFGLEVKTFEGESGKTYLVFRTPAGAFHTFVETEAKAAAEDCGAERKETRRDWRTLWDRTA